MEEKDTKEWIVTEAGNLFLRYGIRSVSMDDIARQVGMSKKTLYQHFKDKDELVTSVAKAKFEEERKDFEEVHATASNPIEECVLFSKFFRKHVKDLNPSLVYDLKKYHPKAWKLFDEHKEGCYQASLKELIRKGQSEGVFRSDLNADILARMRMNQVEMGFDPTVFPPGEYDLWEVQWNFLVHFLNGICTLKGLEEMNRYKDQL